MMLIGSKGLKCAALAALVLVPFGGPPAAADELRIGGTGAAMAMMMNLVEAYVAKRPALRLQVVPSLGSNGSIQAVADSLLDLAVTSRPLGDREIKLGLEQKVVGRTPFVLASAHAKAHGLSSRTIGPLLADERASWEDGTRLKFILRPKSEDDAELIQFLFPGMGHALEKLRQRPDVVLAATDQDNAEAGERIEGALVGMGLVQIKAERRLVRPLPIDGVEPRLENLERGAYPYAKHLYFVHDQRPPKVVQDFIDYLHTPEGRSKLRALAVIPVLD